MLDIILAYQSVQWSHIRQEKVSKPRVERDDAESPGAQEALPPLRHAMLNECSLLLRQEMRYPDREAVVVDKSSRKTV